MEESGALVKVEGNLIEYPFFHLGKRKGKETIKTYDLGDLLLDDGTVINRKLIVRNAEGIPGPYDQDVLMGIMMIGTRDGTLLNDIPLTVYEVARVIDDLSHQERVKRSIKKLAMTTYESQQVILIKETGKKWYLDDVFHILDRATFLGEREKNKRKSREVTTVRFNKYFIGNYINHYYKYIHIGTYLKMEFPIAKKLYMLLEKKRFKKEYYQIGLDLLARVLPLEMKEYYKVREALKKAHEKLLEKEVISSWKFENDRVIYHFPDPRQKVGRKQDKNVLDKLMHHGVHKRVAEQLTKEFSDHEIEKQIEALAFRKAEDPAAMLITSIQSNWNMPAKYYESIKKEKQREIDEEQLKQESNEKSERRQTIEQYLSSLSKDDLAELTREARAQAQEEGGAFFAGREIPQPMVQAYVHMLAERRLGL